MARRFSHLEPKNHGLPDQIALGRFPYPKTRLALLVARQQKSSARASGSPKLFSSPRFFAVVGSAQHRSRTRVAAVRDRWFGRAFRFRYSAVRSACVCFFFGFGFARILWIWISAHDFPTLLWSVLLLCDRRLDGVCAVNKFCVEWVMRIPLVFVGKRLIRQEYIFIVLKQIFPESSPEHVFTDFSFKTSL